MLYLSHKRTYVQLEVMALINRGRSVMKVKDISEIRCPKCGGKVSFTMWNFLDSDLNIEETYALTSGSFFRHICPDCGAGINVYHSVSFNDPRSRSFIKYIQTDQSDEEKQALVRVLADVVREDGIPGYSFKVVFDPKDFIESVRHVRFTPPAASYQPYRAS